MKTIRTIKYKDNFITYLYEQKNVKNINLRIKKDKTIYVSSSPRVSKRYIDEFVLKNAEFIISSIAKMEKTKFNENQNLESGKFITFLGNKYTINVLSSEKEYLDLNAKERIATIFVKDIHSEKAKQKIYDKWQKFCAKEVFTQILEEVYPLFAIYNIKKPEIVYKKLKSRWGSMNVKEAIMTLNIYLIDSPYDCIKYVVVHELAHLVEANHSKEFYKVVSNIIPNYKEYENILKEFTTTKRFL